MHSIGIVRVRSLVLLRIMGQWSSDDISLIWRRSKVSVLPGLSMGCWSSMVNDIALIWRRSAVRVRHIPPHLLWWFYLRCSDFQNYTCRGRVWTSYKFCCDPILVDHLLIGSSLVGPRKSTIMSENLDHRNCTFNQPSTHLTYLFGVLVLVTHLVPCTSTLEYL